MAAAGPHRRRLGRIPERLRHCLRNEAPGNSAGFWLRRESRRPPQSFSDTIRGLMSRYPLKLDCAPDEIAPNYAVVLTDLLRLKPKIFQGGENHLASSRGFLCDSGLAAPASNRRPELRRWRVAQSSAGMGGRGIGRDAYRRLARAAGEIPSALAQASRIRRFSTRRRASSTPPARRRAELRIIQPSEPLGSVRDALHLAARKYRALARTGISGRKKHFRFELYWAIIQ